MSLKIEFRYDTLKKLVIGDNQCGVLIFLLFFQTFKTLCKEGSEAFLEGVYRKAMEKYKEAYDMIDDMPLDMFKINDQDYAVLKYMICLLKIKSANYESIVSAIAVLKEIEEKQARTMPCVYYLLGLAYQALNR